jgi:hypothetical protein
MIDVNNKDNEMTLKESFYLRDCIAILKTYTTNILVPESIAKECIEHDAFIRNDVMNGTIKEFCITPTQDQYMFIQSCLPSFILHKIDIASFKEVLKIYKLDLQMGFVHL